MACVLAAVSFPGKFHQTKVVVGCARRELVRASRARMPNPAFCAVRACPADLAWNMALARVLAATSFPTDQTCGLSCGGYCRVRVHAPPFTSCRENESPCTGITFGRHEQGTDATIGMNPNFTSSASLTKLPSPPPPARQNQSQITDSQCMTKRKCEQCELLSDVRHW